MDSLPQIIAVGAGGLAAVLVLYIIWDALMKPKKVKTGPKLKDSGRIILSYKVIATLPFFKNILFIFERLYYDGGAGRIKSKNASAKNIRKILVLALIIPILSIMFVPYPILWVIPIMLIPFTFVVMKNKYVADIYYSDLGNIKGLIEDIKSEFTATEDIRRTYGNLSLDHPKYSFLVEKIIDILDSEDPDEALSDFFVEAPNKYIKQIVSLSMDVVTYGDTKDVNGVSRFIQGLSILLEEVSQDYLFTREQIETLNFSAVWLFMSMALPYPMLLLANQLKFFETSYDFIGSHWYYVVVYASWIFVLHIMREYTYLAKVRTEYDIVFAEKAFFSKFLKIKLFKTLVGRIAPTHLRTERSVNIVSKAEQKLKEANSNLTVEEFYVQKLVIVPVIFISLILIAPLGMSSYKDSIFNPNWEKIVARDANAALNKNKAGFEYTMMLNLKENGLPYRDEEGNIITDGAGQPTYKKKYSNDELLAHIYYETQYVSFVSNPEDYAKEFLSKYKAYDTSDLPWFIPILCFIISLVGWGVPDLMLSVKARDRQWAVENEIEGFLSVLSMVSSIRNLKVMDLLDYLERYAVVFKHEMLTARTMFVSDPEGAFSYLEETIRNDDMSMIVRKLRQSYNETSIEKAFSDLLPSRKFMLEDRKLQQIRVLEAKRKNLNGIQFTSMAGFMILYLLVPFLISALPQLLEGIGAMDDINQLEEGADGQIK